MTTKQTRDLGPINPETAKVIVAAADMISKLELRVLKLERSRTAIIFTAIGYVLVNFAYDVLRWWLS